MENMKKNIVEKLNIIRSENNITEKGVTDILDLMMFAYREGQNDMEKAFNDLIHKITTQ